MPAKIKLVFILYLSAILILIGGCTTTYRVPEERFTGYPHDTKIPLNVGLIISPEFLDAKWEDSTRVAKFGNALAANSEALAGQVFKSVELAKGFESKAGLDGFLIPKVSLIDSTYGFAWDDLVLTLIVEWSLKDPNGKLIWVDTVKGQATSKSGSFGHEKQFTSRAKSAIDDLFLRSYEAMISSPEIRDYADTTQYHRGSE